MTDTPVRGLVVTNQLWSEFVLSIMVPSGTEKVDLVRQKRCSVVGSLSLCPILDFCVLHRLPLHVAGGISTTAAHVHRSANTCAIAGWPPAYVFAKDIQPEKTMTLDFHTAAGRDLKIAVFRQYDLRLTAMLYV